MAPAAKHHDLLYVSDYATNDVDAYSYPGGKLLGVLKGILKNLPLESGLCSDARGDVFIPDSSSARVLEYPHGSVKLLDVLKDPNEYPYSCAVDPASGDLAVVNFYALSGAGGVSVYAHAGGRPKNYTQGFVYLYYFAAYDTRGDLFVDARYDVPSEPFAFVELPKGAKQLEGITLNQAIAVPGGVGWDGKHVVVADSHSTKLYRFQIAGSTGTKVGATRLAKGRFITQFVLDRGSVIAADYRGATVSFWQYPGGGPPVERIGGFGEPFGVALSRAQR